VTTTRFWPVAILALAACATAATAAPLPPPKAGRAVDFVEKCLTEGRLAEGERELIRFVDENPTDAQGRFGLGFVQFARAVEGLFQALYKAGLGQGKSTSLANQIPFLRLPVPPNPNADKFTYADQRKLLKDFANGLARAEATLAKVPAGEVKLPLHVGLYCLDLDGDGKIDRDSEALWRVHARTSGANITEENARDFVIHFDAADVHWLRGYCHLLMALTEFVLAHDFQEIFEGSAHLFFAKPVTPHKFLVDEPPPQRGGLFGDLGNLSDVIAAVHLLRMPVAEKERMKASLTHLQAASREVRAMWELVLAETDDENEWIPGPKQTSVLGVKPPDGLASQLPAALDEFDDLLAGKKLAPFWRGGPKEKRAVNIRRLFTEPRSFDLVLWIQGTAMTPYLEYGETVDSDTLDNLPRRAGWAFFGFFTGF
jgi:hypothetical protein